MVESKMTTAKRKRDEISAKAEEKPDVKAKRSDNNLSKAVQWLLGDEAFEMANPEVPKGHGEIDWENEDRKKSPPPERAGKHAGEEPLLRYPQSSLTPFQNLVAACLLSKPISHKLGLRTIQTLLNPPFGLRTMTDLDDAGFEGRRKVMWEARTQHKEKTASQLGDLVIGLRDLNSDYHDNEDFSELKGLYDMIEGKKNDDAIKVVDEELQKIKGVGPGVTAIFLRRVQQEWAEIFPYADERVLNAAKELNVIKNSDADLLQKQVHGDRAKFVKLLDVLIGLDLEKKLDQAKKQINKT